MVDKLLKELADYCDEADVVYQISYVTGADEKYKIETYGNGGETEDFAFALAAARVFIQNYNADIDSFCEALKESLKGVKKFYDN